MKYWHGTQELWRPEGYFLGGGGQPKVVTEEQTRSSRTHPTVSKTHPTVARQLNPLNTLSSHLTVLQQSLTLVLANWWQRKQKVVRWDLVGWLVGGEVGWWGSVSSRFLKDFFPLLLRILLLFPAMPRLFATHPTSGNPTFGNNKPENEPQLVLTKLNQGLLFHLWVSATLPFETKCKQPLNRQIACYVFCICVLTTNPKCKSIELGDQLPLSLTLFQPIFASHSGEKSTAVALKEAPRFSGWIGWSGR